MAQLASYWRGYILLLLAGITAIFLLLYEPEQDHLGAIAMQSNPDWYMDFRRSATTEGHDRDILFHDIGQSITQARRADIIILGHSMAQFAFDWRMLEAFEAHHGVRIYNLSSGGDVSGEFLLKLIHKHKLHPKLWIINADETYPPGFFHPVLSDVNKGEAKYVVAYSRWHAFKNVLSRNLRWRTEFLLRSLLPTQWTEFFYANAPIIKYRSIQHGGQTHDFWPNFDSNTNPALTVSSQECHATQEDLADARTYLNALPKAEVIFTLIPYSHACPNTTREIADALHVPYFHIDPQGLTSFDGGAHLDANGARIFTERFLEQLEENEIFQRMIRHPRVSGNP